MKISIKEIVTKREIHTYISSVNEKFSIYDSNENLIFSSVEGEENKSSKFPIKFKNQLLGWIQGDKDQTSVTNFLSYFISSEYEKILLEKENKARYHIMSILFDITEKLSTSLDPEEVAQIIIEETQKIIKSDNTSLMLLNTETNRLDTIGEAGPKSFSKVNLKVGEGIAGSILKTGKAEIINNAVNDARFVESDSNICSIMCAPLKVKNDVIGVINISSNKPANYTPEELLVLSSISLQAAAAIENARLYASQKETFLTAVYTLAETIEKKDTYTGGHTKRVMEYSMSIGEELNLPAKEMERLKLSAILHDVGKIGVKDNILLKRGKLTAEEFDEIKKHTIHGEELLKHIKFFKDIIPGVKYHHERYDGKGYPEGLKGEAIDITARIIAVADAYDAMTTNRIYRKKLSNEEAIIEIKNNAGSQFDPKITTAFLNHIKSAD